MQELDRLPRRKGKFTWWSAGMWRKMGFNVLLEEPQRYIPETNVLWFGFRTENLVLTRSDVDFKNEQLFVAPLAPIRIILRMKCPRSNIIHQMTPELLSESIDSTICSQRHLIRWLNQVQDVELNVIQFCLRMQSGKWWREAGSEDESAGALHRHRLYIVIGFKLSAGE